MQEIIRIPKPTKFQADYKFDCLDGLPHPLDIEKQEWRLTTIYVDTMRDHNQRRHNELTPFDRITNCTNDELERFESIMRRPEVDWAITNSFDGVYIKRFDDMQQLCQAYSYMVYLKAEQCTYWRLKYK